MSIRVSQPQINLREKLTEIDTPPIGAHGSELLNSSSPKETFDLVRAGRKNMIVNGDFQIAQRGTSKTGINSSWRYDTVDNWSVGMSGAGAWTASQDSDVPIGQGFYKSWKWDCTTADSAVDAGDYFLLEHRIEAYRMAHLGWGTARAKPVTLSFWVKSAVAGDCTAMLHGDNFNTTRIVNQVWTINQPNTWEYKTMTFPAHGPENAFTIDNTIGIRLWLWFKAGSTWTAGAGTRNYWRNNASNQQAPGQQVNIASSTSNNLWITGVQLEEGYNATPFEFKTYAEQLHDCQRYVYRIGNMGKQYQVVGNGFIGENGSTKCAKILIDLPVTMRTNPSVIVIGADSFIADTGGAAAAMTCHATANTGGTWTTASSGDKVWLDFGRSAGGQASNGTAVVVYNNNNQGEILLSAEL